MARYRKIDPRIWNDQHFRAFPEREKLIVFYAITAQSNRVGIFPFSPAKAAEDLAMPTETFLKGFGNVCRNLSWGYDSEARVLYIPTWWKYNKPDNLNVLKACLGDLHELPVTALLSEFSANLEYLAETLHDTFMDGLPIPTPKRPPKQDQELEQELDQELEQEKSSAPLGKAITHILGDIPKGAYYLTGKGEKLSGERLHEFKQFCRNFGYMRGTRSGADAWLKIAGYDKSLLVEILNGATREKRQRPAIESNGGTPKWMQGWITERRWEDDASQDSDSVSERVARMIKNA